jgi:hypothetical protein
MLPLWSPHQAANDNVARAATTRRRLRRRGRAFPCRLSAS